MKAKVKKIIAPLLVVLILIFMSIRIGMVLLSADLPKGIITMGLIFPIIITIISIVVLVERIIEIKKGEEDDLGEY